MDSTELDPYIAALVAERNALRAKLDGLVAWLEAEVARELGEDQVHHPRLDHTCLCHAEAFQLALDMIRGEL